MPILPQLNTASKIILNPEPELTWRARDTGLILVLKVSPLLFLKKGPLSLVLSIRLYQEMEGNWHLMPLELGFGNPVQHHVFAPAFNGLVKWLRRHPQGQVGRWMRSREWWLWYVIGNEAGSLFTQKWVTELMSGLNFDLT